MMKYFAYGEKMFSPNVLKIIPGAINKGGAKIMGYRLFCHTQTQQDISGKCNILPVKDPTSEVYGVLYEVTDEERCLLDKEHNLGCGAHVINLRVFTLENASTEEEFAFTYVADKENVFEDLVPYSWYKEMMIEGAKENKLPEDYISFLQQMPAMQDPNIHRATKEKRYLEALCME
jgi:gamma-glutamylcyclotransferase